MFSVFTYATKNTASDDRTLANLYSHEVFKKADVIIFIEILLKQNKPFLDNEVVKPLLLVNTTIPISFQV